MIAQLLQDYYPGEKEIITVGDSYNDLGMIRRFDGYVMASARDDVRKEATKDHVISHVYDLINKLLV